MTTSGPDSAATATTSQRRRIAIADGDATYAKFIAELLARLGHEVVITHDGETLCEIAERGKSDLLIVGTHTTGVRGFELVRRIGRLGFRGPLILHGSGLSESEVAAYRDVGVTMFVDKRTATAALLEAVELAIGGSP